MEIDRHKVVRELEKLHYYILNTNLAEKISERDIMAITNAATVIIEDEKKMVEALKKVWNALHEISQTNIGNTTFERVVTLDEIDRVIEKALEEL